MKRDGKAKGLYSARIDELKRAYCWKAEIIILWFDKLGMTKKQKVDFLSREFASIHLFAPGWDAAREISPRKGSKK